MKTARSLFVAERPMDLIGNTPLLKIKSLSELTDCEIYIKCEFLNPGGSIKDRAAKQMVEDALEQGRLKSGMTIVRYGRQYRNWTCSRGQKFGTQDGRGHAKRADA